MAHTHVDVDSKELVGLVHKMLAKVVFDASKTDAKRLFNALLSSDAVPFMSMELSKSGTFTCLLSLDRSEFAGKLNFTAFRDALAAHLHRTAQALRRDAPLNVFTNEHTNDVVVHHPGVIETQGQVNILVTALEPRGADEMRVKLMFLDPVKIEAAVVAARDDDPPRA